MRLLIGLLTLTALSILGIQMGCRPIDQSKNFEIKNNSATLIDTNEIPQGKFGEYVRYGRSLLLKTAILIGPEGTQGRYLGNKMNCANCHQEAGTKPYSFNLMAAHSNYPQYRAREGKVLSLADRINNCITRPHNGTPLPLDSKEMIAILSYLRWINTYYEKNELAGIKNLTIEFPPIAADPGRGKTLYISHCAQCHAANGEGIFTADKSEYLYPPLWGEKSYQSGSSMFRIIKQAQWLKANMPFGKATWDKPFLSDQEALDIAAYINAEFHVRPNPLNFDYTNIDEKPIDHAMGPFRDTFSSQQHKYGPYGPIIEYWKKKGWEPTY